MGQNWTYIFSARHKTLKLTALKPNSTSQYFNRILRIIYFFSNINVFFYFFHKKKLYLTYTK